MDHEAAYKAAQAWLERGGHDVVLDRGHTLVGVVRADRRVKAGTDVPYPFPEVAVVIVDPATLRSGIAQGRLNAARRWKDRLPKDRWVAIVAPRGIEEAELLRVRGHDQVVHWPAAFYPRVDSVDAGGAVTAPARGPEACAASASDSSIGVNPAASSSSSST